MRPHGAHIAPVHARPERHTSPVQHPPPIAPQPSIGVVQTSSMQARSVPHSLEPMQREPSGALHSPP
jgi:hypothetical protein